MTLDIAMGGSTNTVLHLLAAAEEGGVPFTMADIDRLSRRTPCLCKVAPSRTMCISKTCIARAASWPSWASSTGRRCINRECPTVHSATMADALNVWDVCRTDQPDVRQLYRRRARRRADHRGVQPGQRLDALDLDRAKGVIRSAETAFSKDGGLAVLYGNIAADGCIVKTAGVDDKLPQILRPRRDLREPGGGGGQDPRRRREGRRRGRDPLRRPQSAVLACRKCSIRPAT